MKASVKALPPALLALALLAGCGTSAGSAAAPTPMPPESVPPTGDLPGVEMWEMTCRIVDGAENGALMLAEGEDGPYDGTGIYAFAVGDTPVWIDGEEKTAADLTDGMLVTVTWNGMVAESYPGQLGTVYALSADSGDTDDRCGLYLQVLEDLWETDPGLNTGLEELAVDFSGLTDLTESEKAALAWEFGNAHGLMPITGTWEELVEQGHIDGENLVWNGSGCLFTLTGSAEEGFQAEKWASGLGAYFFTGCTARKSADGAWTYEVGGHAIA